MARRNRFLHTEQSLSTERGNLCFICMCYTFIHVVNLEINIRDDSPGSNTMWNDITSWEKPRGQHKRKTGDNKKGSNSNNFRFPFYFPSSKLCSLHTNKSS